MTANGTAATRRRDQVAKASTEAAKAEGAEADTTEAQKGLGE